MQIDQKSVEVTANQNKRNASVSVKGTTDPEMLALNWSGDEAAKERRIAVCLCACVIIYLR